MGDNVIRKLGGVGGKIISKWRRKREKEPGDRRKRKPDRLVPGPQKYPNSRQKWLEFKFEKIC